MLKHIFWHLCRYGASEEFELEKLQSQLAEAMEFWSRVDSIKQSERFADFAGWGIIYKFSLMPSSPSFGHLGFHPWVPNVCQELRDAGELHILSQPSSSGEMDEVWRHTKTVVEHQETPWGWKEKSTMTIRWLEIGEISSDSSWKNKTQWYS